MSYIFVSSPYLLFQFSDISNKIYMSNWYENNVRIQKLLLIIMTQCQRHENLSAGGIIDINVETLGSVSSIILQ